MTPVDDRSFRPLVSAWKEHQDLRASEAPIRDLAASRWRLDALRLEARKAS